MPQIVQDQNDPNVTYTIDTPEEAAEKVAAQAVLEANYQKIEQKALIQDQLDTIDLKSIRALRTNDVTRMASLETQATLLRQQLAAIN